MTNLELAAGLREMADFYETHDAPMPAGATLYVFCYSRDEFLKAARALQNGGRIEKSADPPDNSYSQYHATRHFGVAAVDVQISRSLVCRLVRPAEYDCPDVLLAGDLDDAAGEGATA